MKRLLSKNRPSSFQDKCSFHWFLLLTFFSLHSQPCYSQESNLFGNVFFVENCSEGEPSGPGVQNVNVRLIVEPWLSGTQNFSDLTDSNGDFEFTVVDEDIFPWVFIAMELEKPCTTLNCWMNGVTTFDLYLIQQHILGIQIIDCPFQRMAADANFDGLVTTSDIVLLRNLILFNISELPNPAWRFVSDRYYRFYQANPDQNFPPDFWDTATNPNFPFIALYNYEGDTYEYMGNPLSWLDHLNEWEFDLSEEDAFTFGAYKVGDVNGSANPGQFQNNEPQYRNSAALFSDKEIAISAGTEFLLSVRANNFVESVAYQMGLRFDQRKIEFIDFKKGDLQMFDKDNFGLKRLEHGELRAIWIEPSIHPNVDFENPVLFSLHLKSKENLQNLLDFMNLDDQILDNKFYLFDGSLARVDLDFEIQRFPSLGELTSGSTEIFPNPFREEAILAFNLPLSAELKITIGNSWGKILETYQRLFEEGYNEFALGRNLPAGVFFYSIEGGNHFVNGKMVKTN